MNWSEKDYQDYVKRKNLIPVLPPTKNLSLLEQTKSKKIKQTPKSQKIDSYAETVFEREYIAPLVLVGEIAEVESHRTFELLPKCELCGQKLRRKVFTPDYIIHFADGTIKVVEIKGNVVKKLQREYQIRKHLFIEKYCLPNEWLYEEISAESLTQK